MKSRGAVFFLTKVLGAQFIVTIRGKALPYIGGDGDPLTGCASLAFLSS